MPSQLPISVQSVVAVGEKVMASRLMDEVVILDLKSGIYHGLEAVGARVWEILHQPAHVQSVRDVLLAEYEVEPVRCEQDLLTFLEELKNHGLLDVRSAAMGEVLPPQCSGALAPDLRAGDGGAVSDRTVDAAVSMDQENDRTEEDAPTDRIAQQTAVG